MSSEIASEDLVAGCGNVFTFFLDTRSFVLYLFISGPFPDHTNSCVQTMVPLMENKGTFKLAIKHPPSPPDQQQV
jgi:hypothetical protein